MSRPLLQHPLSAAFPAMADDERTELRDSIESIGVQNAITLFEGMVLDGWHRYSIAQALGVDCPHVELGDVDPRDFVLAQNRARRSLSASQRALAAVAVFQWRPIGTNQHGGSAPGAGAPKTNAQLAGTAGVSERTIRQAKVVDAAAPADVARQVRDGSMSVKRAAAIAMPPKAASAPSGITTAEAPQREAEARADEISELRSMLADTIADNQRMGLIFDADDQLKAALAENVRLHALVATLEERIRGLQNERNAAIKQAKSWQRKAGATA